METQTHTIVCKRCEKVIGEAKTEDNGNAVCLTCYYKK